MAEKIVIASGKGGVGKSSLTAGLARALSGAGKRVLMLDMDIGLRSLDLIFGTQKDVLFDWGNVIDGVCEPNQAALAAGGPMLMTAPMRMSDSFTKESMKELVDKLAALYGIPVEDILDDYTLFLHRGGGAFLRRYREAKGWSRQQLADHAKVSRTSIRCWESGQKTISQKCFCHLVENIGSDFPSMLRM